MTPGQVNKWQWTLTLSLLATLIDCKPTSDGFYSPRSFQPHQERHNLPREESYRHVQYQPYYHQPQTQAVSYSEPQIITYQNDYLHPAGSGYGGHFQPNVRSMLFENPLKKAMEQGAEQVQQSMQEMGKQMSEVAEQHGQEIGKQLHGMREQGEAAMGELPSPPPPPGLPGSRSIKKDPVKEGDKKKKKKGEVDDDKEEEEKADDDDAKDDNPLKKMAQAGSDLMKKIPDSMPTPENPLKVMSEVFQIKDETSEAHNDHYYEDGEGPRAERMEWNVPDIYDVGMQPRSDYFDYYDVPY